MRAFQGRAGPPGVYEPMEFDEARTGFYTGSRTTKSSRLEGLHGNIHSHNRSSDEVGLSKAKFYSFHESIDDDFGYGGYLNGYYSPQVVYHPSQKHVMSNTNHAFDMYRSFQNL